MLIKVIVLLLYIWNELDQPFFEEPIVEVFSSRRDLDAFKKHVKEDPGCIYDMYEPILKPEDNVHITFGVVTEHKLDVHNLLGRMNKLRKEGVK